MRKFKLAAVGLIAIAPFLTPVKALDLTPHAVTSTINNIRVNRYYFDDAGKRMAFRVDNNTTVKGAATSASFKFTDVKNAEMQIAKSPKNPEVLFSGKELEAYRNEARALLPANATDVQVDRENADAVAINGWTSYQFIFNYKLFGFAYRSSVTYLNYNKSEQLIIGVSAPASDFDTSYLRSYQVLNSLSELRAGTLGST